MANLGGDAADAGMDRRRCRCRGRDGGVPSQDAEVEVPGDGAAGGCSVDDRRILDMEIIQ